eukprot:COSAG06_NODE_71412_length_184_cov_32.341176_1_plen_29_part_01
MFWSALVLTYKMIILPRHLRDKRWKRFKE